MSKRSKHHSSKTLLIVGMILLLLISLVWLAIEPIQRQIYPTKYRDTVEAVAKEYEFSPSFVYAVIFTESKFDPSATSAANARGLMQITDSTYHWACKRAKQEAEDPQVLYDPDTNIRYGVYILSLLRERFSDTETLLAAYNAGQGHVNEWLSNPAYSNDGKTLTAIPYQETEDYVRRVINAQKKYQELYNIP